MKYLTIALFLLSITAHALITEIQPDNRTSCAGITKWRGCFRGFTNGQCQIEIVTGMAHFWHQWTLLHEQVHCLGYDHGEEFDEAMRFLHSGLALPKVWPLVSLPMKTEGFHD